MSELVHNAIAFATQAHRRINQMRKYSGQPYEVHLKAVATIVGSVSDDPEMIAAAWLHDVVEDTPATIDDVERVFGRGMAALVHELTDVSRPGQGNRSARVRVYREHLAASSARAKTVKLADLIDNARDIVRHDARFAPTFLAEMAALLEVLGEGDARLFRKARAVLDEASVKLGLGQPGDASDEQSSGLQEMDRALVKKHARTIGVFARTFTAEDIAEPLHVMEAGAPAEEISRQLEARNLTVAGVQDGAGVLRYVQAGGPGKEKAGGVEKPVARDQVLPPESSLSDVIEVLTRHDYCFVGRPGEITGVISRRDIQKPVTRMWLFGVITLLEIYFTHRISRLWPDGSWTRLLPPKRLSAAQALRDERRRREQPCELLECLQLADKGEVLIQNPTQLVAFGFDSRGAAKRVMKDIQSLRNNLAHAQDIVSHDWPQIVRLARRIEGMYRIASPRQPG